MFCRFCGGEVPDNPTSASFCPFCGKSLTEAEHPPLEVSFVDEKLTQAKIIAAAAAEKSSRTKQTLAPSVPLTPANSSTATGRTPILATCAAIGSFLWAAIMFLLVLYQLGLAVTQNSAKFATLGLWNALIAAAYVAIGIGVLIRKKWAWDWGIGSNTLNMVFGIYQLTQGVWGNILFLPVELFIVIALSSTRSVVAPTLTRRQSETPAATVPQQDVTDPPSGSTVQGPDVGSPRTAPSVMSRKWLGLVLVLGVLVLLYAVASVLGRKPVQSGENDASDTRQRNKIERTDNAHFGDGTFIIGEDIQPGTYRASSPSRGCYYARLSGFGGSVDDILANANTDYPTVVTIQPTDKGFKSDGCGTWTAVSSSVATPASIPFVGCPSDGQVGPLKAPSGNGPNISAPPELAKQLAYYKSKTSPLVLGPRGWSCFGVYGSNGDVLYISPSPISGSNALANDGSGGFTGAAIEVAVRFGGTSGRYDVAKLINRVFPSHKDFATRVIGDGFAPASDFPSGPYPQDKLTYKSNEVVEFATPAHTDGLGTDSFLRQNDSPISGVVILVEKAGEAPDSWYLALRLPLEFENLSQIIIQQLERAANVGGTVQQEPPAPVRHGTPHVENYQTPSPPANAPSATPNTQNLPSERPADAPRLALPPQPSTPASLPAPPAEVAKPTSGVLCNWPVEIPQNGEVKFRNLPSDRLKFTFDHDAWLPRIHREPDGTQTLIMRSIKPDVQTKCDIRWEIVQ